MIPEPPHVGSYAVQGQQGAKPGASLCFRKPLVSMSICVYRWLGRGF